MKRALIALMVLFLTGSVFGEWVPLFNGKLDGDINPLYSHGLSRSRPLLFDVDDDSDADLVWGERSGLLRFWENVGTPSLPDWRMRSDNWGGVSGIYDVYPALGDLDNDRDYDLILCNGDGAFYYFENTGGTPVEPVYTLVDEHYLPVVGVSYTAPFLVDIDNDDDQDLFFGTSAGRVWFFRNEGDPETPNFVYVDSQYVVLTTGYGVDPSLCDMDSDGDFDMVLHSDRYVFLMRNLGTPESPAWDELDSAYFPLLPYNSIAIAIWDLYDTGKPAIIVGPQWTRIYHYWNTGTVEAPTWEVSPEFWETIDVSYRVRLIYNDLTGDGLPELLVFGYETSIGLENMGIPGEPDWSINPALIENLEPLNSNPCLGDLDGDGDLDVVITPAYSEIMFQENVGSASFPVWAEPTTAMFGINYGMFMGPGLVDIDADGDLDLFVGTQSCSLYFHENIGTPTSPEFDDGVLLEEFLDDRSYLYRPAFCFTDFDDDGDYDMFAGCDNNYMKLAYWENLGDSASPVWGDVDGYYVESSVGGLTDVEVWDYDNDGDDDLICGSSFGGVVVYLDGACPGITEQDQLPADFSLNAYPNPFNSSVKIAFNGHYNASLQLEIYDINGRMVFYDGDASMTGKDAYPYNESTSSSFTWSPTPEVSSGLYLCKMTAGDKTGCVKILYMK